MNISIFGLGYVGCVSLGCLAQLGHKVVGVDINQLKVNQINNGQATIIEKDIDQIISKQRKNGLIKATADTDIAIKESSISIICVGTPNTSEGHLDLSAVFAVAKDIGKGLAFKSGFHTIAIRSTVLPGTCEKVTDIIANSSGKKQEVEFSVVSNPEFLREGSAVFDYYNPPFTLIGTNNEKASLVMEEIYKKIDAEFIVTVPRSAEIMKYINNSFHALKVSFANEVGNICKELNIDSNKVMDIFVKDTQLNISSYYLKPGFAYGGSCLPKDLKALKTLSHDLYLNTPVINAINESNEEQINRAQRLINRLKFNKIAVLGISFKAGTDDLRNSPVVSIVEYLIGRGHSIRIFDKNVNYAILKGANKDYIDSHISHFKELMFESIDRTIYQSEIVIIGNRDKSYIDILKNYNGVIFDLVRLDETLVKKENYIGINW